MAKHEVLSRDNTMRDKPSDFPEKWRKFKNYEIIHFLKYFRIFFHSQHFHYDISEEWVHDTHTYLYMHIYIVRYI